MNPPASDLDPFSGPFFADPYPGHETLRETGPVVRLTHCGIWAMARYQEVHAALHDRRAYDAAAGIGFGPASGSAGPLLEPDPPLHARMRAVLTRILSPPALRRLRQSFAAAADDLVETLVRRGRFDAIADLAEAYPVKGFPDALGIVEDGREHLLAYGAMAAEAFGPTRCASETAAAKLAPARDWVAAACARNRLAPAGFGVQVYQAADRGEIGRDEAAPLVRALLSAGVDTAVNGLGAAIWAFLRNPEQWALLHREPGLARAAFDEGLRWESPLQTCLRTTRRAVTVGPTRLGEGETVLLLLGAANRDPRRWQEPERFDIRRATAGHVAFGGGIRGCVGQVAAQMQGEFILGALARRVDRIELAGEPRRRRSSTLRTFASLPVAVRRA
jgi:cytochrome P450